MLLLGGCKFFDHLATWTAHLRLSGHTSILRVNGGRHLLVLPLLVGCLCHLMFTFPLHLLQVMVSDHGLAERDWLIGVLGLNECILDLVLYCVL